jgi:REP element-mobilizing transposase RayT
VLRKGSSSKREYFNGKHRLEHWYRDNTVYFLTVRCTNRVRAFASDAAKEIFWRQFDKYTQQHGFQPWVVTLIDNHYHAVDYLKNGNDLAPMMRKIHGSVAKLVNDILPQRLLPFWSEYFDGCLRNEKQYRLAYRYTLSQAKRHGVCRDWREYKHTRAPVGLEEGLQFAVRNRCFLAEVPYQRYVGRTG